MLCVTKRQGKIHNIHGPVSKMSKWDQRKRYAVSQSVYIRRESLEVMVRGKFDI